MVTIRNTYDNASSGRIREVQWVSAGIPVGIGTAAFGTQRVLAIEATQVGQCNPGSAIVLVAAGASDGGVFNAALPTGESHTLNPYRLREDLASEHHDTEIAEPLNNSEGSVPHLILDGSE